ncbi:kinase-like domain-containing protein [Cantharellus anzutake]|uniref:kinase-like domain-containing protein n=1 Tax=Cantharellus anzutake TaxID=1750568 RepID=UPI00190424E3|nr:kinase-like domain-containing protein [Cantharellus anzutake]KAF8323606.1 kinase-like domain-containing protein [Cantharellus anzutake]
MQGWMMRLDDDGNLNVGLVSPWYPRGNVNSYLAENPEADRKKLVFDIFCGLNYLHDAKTVHGNLKPTNILIKFDGTAVLCDYGLQTLLRDTGITFQSIRYTAPELRQNDGGAFQCSYEGDIWAFGCVSIEIMTDQRPYDTIDKETEILVTEIPAYTTDNLQPIDSAEIKSCLNAPPKERSSREVIQEWVDWQS